MTDKQRPSPGGNRGKGKAQKGLDDYTPPAGYPWPLDAIQRNFEAVCYHEAGHLVMLHHFGCMGHIRINPPDYSNPDLTPFSGYVQPVSLPDDLHARRMIALAGVAADCLRDTPDLDASELGDWLEFNVVELSDADAALAEGYQQHHLDYVVRLLRSKWQQVIDAAFWELAKWPGGAQ